MESLHPELESVEQIIDLVLKQDVEVCDRSNIKKGGLQNLVQYLMEVYAQLLDLT